jgi:hypothetical protein
MAEQAALNRTSPEGLLAYEAYVNKMNEAISAPCSIIGENARIAQCSDIINVIIGNGAIIFGATCIENATILSEDLEKTIVSHGAIIKNSCIQWGCHIKNHAIVEKSIHLEYSSAENHAKVISSIIGPNTTIAQGEVNASLVGPFVGFHHQSLLIGTIWPKGKGNVGHGANIGSNHTGKAPDQELMCGEGVFFGLGINVKFPADFSKAPYSIIGTAVNTHPQRVTFPFSLINTPSDIPEGTLSYANEIYPGWVLSDNLYSVMRNEAKFRNRNKAKRWKGPFEVFRPEIVDMMVSARNSLRDCSAKKEVYTQRDFNGLGRNFLRETFRRRGVSSYTYFIEYYVLTQLFRIVDVVAKSAYNKLINNELYTRKSDDAMWEHARGLLITEQFDNKSITENLQRYSIMLENICTSVQESKERDDGRGKQIIEDYAVTHKIAAEDGFVISLKEEMGKKRERIEEILKLE